MGIQVALLGAGGKMGCRITDQLQHDGAYSISYVEPGETGQARLASRGITAVDPPEEAVPGADVVVLAVPDERIGTVAREVLPLMERGSMLLLLDPAAAHAGVLPERADITVFVSHPCHPSFLMAETSLAAEHPDWFGGQGLDTQDIICALHRGDEADYPTGEAIARDIFAPVRTAHRVTTAQMAILEPALVETVLGTCLTVLREGMERATQMGVPEDAARAMLYGHLRIEFGIIFGHTDFPLSDGAQLAIEDGKRELLRDDWEDRVFDPENVKQSVERIAGDEAG